MIMAVFIVLAGVFFFFIHSLTNEIECKIISNKCVLLVRQRDGKNMNWHGESQSNHKCIEEVKVKIKKVL